MLCFTRSRSLIAPYRSPAPSRNSSASASAAASKSGK